MKFIPILLSVMSFSAFAQSTSINTSQKDLSTSFLEKIKPDRISHFSIVFGPGLDGNGSPVDSNGTVQDDGISSWHQISFGYNITKKTRFVVNPRFLIEKSSVSDSTSVGKLADPVIGITSTWYKNGNFTFSGGLNTILAAVSDSAIDRGTEWNPGGFQTINYDVNDKISIGSWLWGRYEYHRKDSTRRRAPMGISPYFTYSAADKLNLQAFYEVTGKVTNADTLSWSEGDNLNLSFSYKFNKTLSIKPIVTVFKNTDYDLAKGNLNFWISGSFL